MLGSVLMCSHWWSCRHRNLYDFYHYFYMLTNVLFYVSSAINPVLYNLLSVSYRQLFLSTLCCTCMPRQRARQRARQRRQRSAVAGRSTSISSNHTLCTTNTIRETVY